MTTTCTNPQPELNLLGMPKQTTPAWLRKAQRGARKLEGRCTCCKTQYLKAELNANGHCSHCADELGESHPFMAIAER